MPTEAVVRLTQGRAAEVLYKAARNPGTNTTLEASSLPSPTSPDATDDSSANANGEVNGSSDGGSGRNGKASLRFESQQFSLLRRESDKFNDGDMPRRPQESPPQAAASPSLLPPEPPPTPPRQPSLTPQPGTAPTTSSTEVGNPAGYSQQPDIRRDVEHEGKSTPPPPPLQPQPLPPSSSESSSTTEAPGWDGPEAAGFLIADGFLVPGKADGGVYLVLPTASEENGSPVAEGGGGGGGGGGGTAAAPTERIVRLTTPKRSVAESAFA